MEATWSRAEPLLLIPAPSQPTELELNTCLLLHAVEILEFVKQQYLKLIYGLYIIPATLSLCGSTQNCFLNSFIKGLNWTILKGHLSSEIIQFLLQTPDNPINGSSPSIFGLNIYYIVL